MSSERNMEVPKMNERFFTEAQTQMSPDDIENYHRAVFMNMEGEYAKNKRQEFWNCRRKR